MLNGSSAVVSRELEVFWNERCNRLITQSVFLYESNKIRGTRLIPVPQKKTFDGFSLYFVDVIYRFLWPSFYLYREALCCNLPRSRRGGTVDLYELITKSELRGGVSRLFAKKVGTPNPNTGLITRLHLIWTKLIGEKPRLGPWPDSPRWIDALEEHSQCQRSVSKTYLTPKDKGI